jgi:hypothetical protein
VPRTRRGAMGRGHATCTGRPQARNDRGSGVDLDLDDFKA